MGFFSKIKENLQKGGVKISMQAPDSIGKDDETLPVSLTISAGETPRSILGIKIELVRHWSEKNGDDWDSGTDTVFSFLVPDSTFELRTNETKSLSAVVPLTASKAAESAEGASPMLETAAKVVDSINKAAALTNRRDYDYKLKCIANVDGIAIDPTATKNMQVYIQGQWKISF